MRRDTVAVKDDTRNGSLPKPWRYCHVYLRRHEIAYFVNRHCALVRYNGHPSTPQCPLDKVIERTLWPLPEAVDPSIFPNPVATSGMVVLKLLRIACGLCLGGREITSLAHRKLVETPSGVLGIHLCHSCNKVTYIFTFCNTTRVKHTKVRIYFTYVQRIRYPYRINWSSLTACRNWAGPPNRPAISTGVPRSDRGGTSRIWRSSS